MKAIILGSGGVIPPPRPGSNTRVSKEARTKGIPYYRTGPSFYIKDVGLLFDCPEEIREQLNREGISDIKNVIITHWHPDHTLGIRILEQYNWDFVYKKPIRAPIKVYIEKKQFEDFKKRSCGGFLESYEEKGIIKIIFFKSNDTLNFGSIKVCPVYIKKSKGYYFVITDKNNKKIVYAPCEYHGLKVDLKTKNADIFIVHNLFWKDKSISPREIPPLDEDSFEKMLEHAEEMSTKKIIITHIEETFGLGHDDLNRLLKKKFSNFNIQASYDGMKVYL